MTTARQTQLGSAAVQGRLWGSRASDFTTQEPQMMALYESVLNELRVARDVRLLDVGCGPGLFLKLAEQRGATVTGLDAAAEFIELARKRLPTSELVVGEMEELPFDARAFDVVTGLDAFPFAADPERALAEATRVATIDAAVVIATWGAPEQCEAAPYVTEVSALLPPSLWAKSGPFALSERAQIDELAASAGLRTELNRRVSCVWEYADQTELLCALKSQAFAVRAINAVGEDAVTRAVLNAVAPYRLSDGGYRLENVFVYVIARARRQ